MSLLDEISYYLSSNGILTPITKTQLTDLPDDQVAIIEYGGSPPEYVFGSVSWETPRFQVLVRSASYRTARGVSTAIFNLLASVQDKTISSGDSVARYLGSSSGTYYLSITPMQSPFLFNRDAKARIEIACNYRVEKVVS